MKIHSANLSIYNFEELANCVKLLQNTSYSVPKIYEYLKIPYLKSRHKYWRKHHRWVSWMSLSMDRYAGSFNFRSSHHEYLAHETLLYCLDHIGIWTRILNLLREKELWKTQPLILPSNFSAFHAKYDLLYISSGTFIQRWFIIYIFSQGKFHIFSSQQLVCLNNAQVSCWWSILC